MPPKARWWSVTAYSDDLFLLPNAQRRYSVNGKTTALDAEGRFSFVSGPAAPTGAASGGASGAASSTVSGAPADSAAASWLPTPGEGGLMYTLRVYIPDPALAAAPAALHAPIIEPVGVCP